MTPPVLLPVGEDALRPIVRAVFDELLARLPDLPPDRDGYTEAEAAARLGIKKAVLRDARQRGEIAARRVGRGYVYGRIALLRWVNAGHAG